METEKWITVIVTSSDRNFCSPQGGKDVANLKSLPKALYPIAGVPLIDMWLRKISQSSIISLPDLYIVSNQDSHSKMMEWGQSRSIPSHNILISDVNGEIGALRMMIRQHEEIVQGNNILLINSDVLVDCDLSLSPFLSQLSGGMCLSCTCNSVLNILIDDQNCLISDSASSGIHNSHLVPVYSLPSASFEYLKTLPETITSSCALLKYLCVEQQIKYQTTPVTHYYPMDSLENFDHATSYFEDCSREMFSHLPSHVNVVCPARAGLMGNPSDGFHGKTLSFIVNNFYAQVTITSNPTLAVELIPHPVFDMTHFQSFDSLHKETQLNGYYGGLRLLKATCRSFARRCCQFGLIIHLQRGFTISYDTTIPRRVGLSGSSAIIVAAYKALMEFFGLSLHDLKLELSDFPQVILDIEKEELGIAAGLQDRVIQTYGGIVHMDFSAMQTEAKGVYTPLDPSMLPELYLLYNTEEGGDSGKVHSTAKARWLNGDPVVIAGMKALGQLADNAKECLITGDMRTLATLMNQNFHLRRELYGDNVVGKKNILVATLANEFGFACKFTGSGGAFVCLRKNGEGWLPSDEEEKVKQEFQKEGFEFIRIEKLV